MALINPKGNKIFTYVLVQVALLLLTQTAQGAPTRHRRSSFSASVNGGIRPSRLCTNYNWDRADRKVLLQAIHNDALSLIPTVSHLRRYYAEERLSDNDAVNIPVYDGIHNTTKENYEEIMRHYYKDTASLIGIWRAMKEGENQHSTELSSQYILICNSLKRLLCKLQQVTSITESQTALIEERIEALVWYHRFLNNDNDYVRRKRDVAFFYFTEDFLSRFYVDVELIAIRSSNDI